MENRRSTHFKNALAITSLILSLAAVQSPLWRPPVPPQCVIANAGGTALLTYDRAIARASIFQTRTATMSADGPGRILIHGHAPGKTSVLIRYKDGGSRLYQVVILPG